MFIPRKNRLIEHLEIKMAAQNTQDFARFHTLNFSCSGALIASFQAESFEINQLTVVCIDPSCEFLPMFIACKAVVVRTIEPNSDAFRKYIAQRGIVSVYGIKFCDMLNEDLDQLEELINKELKHTA